MYSISVNNHQHLDRNSCIEIYGMYCMLHVWLNSFGMYMLVSNVPDFDNLHESESN